LISRATSAASKRDRDPGAAVVRRSYPGPAADPPTIAIAVNSSLDFRERLEDSSTDVAALLPGGRLDAM
jgi:hypothetical protein